MLFLSFIFIFKILLTRHWQISEKVAATTDVIHADS